jgi:hypothetical protein
MDLSYTLMADARIIPHDNLETTRQDSYLKAAYASEAVVHLLSEEGFASEEVRGLYQDRSGFRWKWHRSEENPLARENRFLGAVLNKLGQRGNPAPCSLKVENYVLQKAQDVGLLVFQKSNELGRIQFSCKPLIEDLELLLRICFLPELLIDDSEIDLLLRHHEALLEGSLLARQFYKKLRSILPDRRMALFVVPGRLWGQDLKKGILNTLENVDFIIYVPNLKRNKPLRIAIVLGEGPCRFDEMEDWSVKRFGQMKQQYWESEIRKLAEQVSYALPNDLLEAARRLGELPGEKKKALLELVALPIAEAQLTQVMAELIYRGFKGEINIGNPQELDMAVVMEAVQETIDALSSLYGIKAAVVPRLADDHMKPDLEYCSFLTASALSCDGIAPLPSISCNYSVQISATPRPINRSDADGAVRNSLRFILNNVFRCQEFLEDQAELIEQMLSMQGSIGLLKPNGGKTVAYQLASILQPGTSLVVVPTVFASLEQGYSLAARGVHRCRAIVSDCEEDSHDAMDSMSWHESYILFLAADTPLDRVCKARLKNIFSNTLNFLVLDEAYGLSEWSHGFQPAYLNLVRYIRDSCAFKGLSGPGLIALNSHNSRLQLLDIMNEFGLEDLDCIVESASYECRNLKLEIHKVNANNRKQVLIAALRATLREHGWQGRDQKIPSGLVISACEDDEDMNPASFSDSLGSYLNIPLGVCSLKPPKKFLRLGGSRMAWERECAKALLQFKRHKLPILICSANTAAQLDKGDLRFTLHASMPASLEEFYRQSCLEGHDRTPSTCLIFFSDGGEIPGSKEISNEFPGSGLEKQILSQVFMKLHSRAPINAADDGWESAISVSSIPDRLFLKKGDLKVSSEWRQKLLEKALYRLQLIGAIGAYEKRQDSFGISLKLSEASDIYNNYKKYISRYEIESSIPAYLPKENRSSFKIAVLQCGCSLIDYDYGRIMTKKESDLEEMLKVGRNGQASFGMLQDYLHELTEPFERIGDLEHGDSVCRLRVLEEITGSDELLGLLLACRRELKLRPDDAALRLIAGFCALAFTHTGQINSDLVEGFCCLKSSLAPACRADAARQMISYAVTIMPSKKDLILESIWQADPSLEIARLCYERSELSSGICHLSLFKLVNGLLEAFKAEGVGQ